MSSIIYRDSSGYVVKKYYSRNNRKTEYVIYNVNKQFIHHTHVNNFYMCKKLIYCVKHRTYDDPKIKNSTYLLESLKRLTTDKKFLFQLEDRLEFLYSNKDKNL
jgi:hypothetical protein